jgi:hypothetical protein
MRRVGRRAKATSPASIRLVVLSGVNVEDLVNDHGILIGLTTSRYTDDTPISTSTMTTA